MATFGNRYRKIKRKVMKKKINIDLKYKKLLIVLASFVVFFTTYSLILPAITLESDKVKTENNLGIVLTENKPEENTEAETAQETETAVETQTTNTETSESVNTTETVSDNVETVIEENNKETEIIPALKELELINEETILSHQGSNYTVYAEFNAEAKFPKGINLIVNEINADSENYEKYKNVIEDTFNSEGNPELLVQLLDIHFELDGIKYQPATNIKIKIEYNDGPLVDRDDVFQVVHFIDDETVEIIENETTSNEKLKDITVSTDSFSTYATVRSTDATPIVIGGKNYYTVKFSYINSNNETKDTTYLVEATANATIGNLPQDPFVAGKRFVKWVDAAQNTASPTTPVTRNMEFNAVFEEIEEYEVKVEYIYFNNAQGKDVAFDTEIYKLAEYDLPYEIKTPKSSIIKKTDDNTLTNDAIYYPETEIITLNDQASLDQKDAADGTVDKKITIKHRYGPTNARFFYVYKLKNLYNGNYSDIKRVEARGLVGSTVTPPIEIIPYAKYERSESTEIHYEDGQEIPVYYTRGKAYVSFDSNGGSYVPKIEGIYGESRLLPASNPTKTGYTFEGWYEDKELTKKVTSGNVVLDKDKTLYAKWTPAQVKYTILYYRKQYDENDYIGNTTHEQNQAVQPKDKYIGSVEGFANSDSIIYANNMPDITGTDPNTGYEYTVGYQRDNARNNTSAVVKPDGTTVIKVYYEPKTYTYEFRTNRNDAVITHLGVNKGNSYSFTAKTGQYIAQNWPVNWSGTNRTITSTASGVSFLRWAYKDTQNGSLTMQQFVSLEHIARGADSSNKISYDAIWSKSNEGIYVRTTSNPQMTTEVPLLVPKYGAARVNYYFEKQDQPGVYVRNALQSEDITWDKLADITAKGFTGYQVLNDGEIRALASSYQRTRQANKPVQNGLYCAGGTIRNGRCQCRVGQQCTTYPIFPNPPLTQQTDVHNGKTYDRIFEFYYKLNRYNIEYKYNAAANNIPNGSAQDVLVDTKNNLISGTNINNDTYNFVPTRPVGVDSDYTWGGWHEDAALQVPAFSQTNPMLLGSNKVFYAKWTPPKFNVNFELNGGTAGSGISTQIVDKYTKITQPAEPTKNFHKFKGWYTAREGGTEFDFNSPITQNTTLYARWELLPIEYTIRYIDRGTNQSILSDVHIQGPDLTLGQVIEANAVGVPGYRPEELKQRVTLTDNFDQNVITFYYNKKNDSLTYTVDYVLQSDPTKKVATSKVEVAGATVVKVRELAKATDITVMQGSGISGDDLLKEYYPIKQSDELVISSNQAHNKIVFEYVPRNTAIIELRYLDMDGNPIPGHNNETILLNTPNIFKTIDKRREVNGFTYAKTIDSENGSNIPTYVFNDGKRITINYYYKKNLIVKPRSDTKVYDGTALALRDGNANDVEIATATPLARGDKVGAVVFANKTITNVGNVSPRITRISITDGQNRSRNDYYNIDYTQPGTLTVTEKPITIYVDGLSKTVQYDGQIHNTANANGEYYTLRSSDPNYQINDTNIVRQPLSSAAINAQRNVGPYTVNMNHLNIRDNDPNHAISFVRTNGKLEITKRPATITLNNVTMSYNGQEQQISGNDNSLASYSGFVDNEHSSITITPHGSRTLPGKTSVTFDWSSTNNLIGRNYNITTIPGTLEITSTINIQKTDINFTKVLTGSRFNLDKKNATGGWEAVAGYSGDANGSIVLDENGSNLSGLTPGEYRLTEYKAPDGYVIIKKYAYFNINKDVDENYVVALVTGPDGLSNTEIKLASGTGDYNNRIQIANKLGVELPHTGGIGTKVYSYIGILILSILGGYYKLKKKD